MDNDVVWVSLEEKTKNCGVAGRIMMWRAGRSRAAEGAELNDVMASARETTRLIFVFIVVDLPLDRNDVAVLILRLGSDLLIEFYIPNEKIAYLLDVSDLKACDRFVDNTLSSLDMMHILAAQTRSSGELGRLIACATQSIRIAVLESAPWLVEQGMNKRAYA